jgi:hypothetical protein
MPAARHPRLLHLVGCVLLDARMRKYARQDTNHSDIRSAFERLGCSVVDLSPLGNGCPDLLIGLGGLCIVVEIKDGSKPPSARKLTKDEERFRMNWTGSYKIVENLEGVTETVALMQGWLDAIS